MKPIDKISNLLAKAFHPIFLVFYLSIVNIFINQARPMIQRLEIAGVFFVLTALLPILFVYFYNKGDMYLTDQKKRSLPLLVTTILYGLCFFFQYFSDNYIIFAMLLNFIIGLLALWLINFFYKISLHGAGVGIIIVYLLFFSYGRIAKADYTSLVSVAICAALLILVLRQRIVSGAHTPNEVVWGFFLGASSVLLTAWLVTIYLFGLS